MTLATVFGTLAEIAGTAHALADYERRVLDVVAPCVGFDVAMFKRPAGVGPHTPGLEPKVKRACAPYWAAFAAETQPLAQAAASQRNVVVDVEVLGLGRMERLAYYQRLMRPHRGRSTAMVYLQHRGQRLAALALGRTGGGFRERELETLRRLAPMLALCEATAAAAPARAELSALTPREHEVLGFLPLGYTNAQIALALGSAERTVRNQLSSVYEKLGVASRAEAVAVAIELGLAPGAP